MLDRPPSPGHLRQARSRKRRRAQLVAAQRRFRQREAAGDVLVSHRFTVAEVATLHRLGYLREHELENRAAIDAALGALLANIVIKPDA
jgi:hypothetical protein